MTTGRINQNATRILRAPGSRHSLFSDIIAARKRAQKPVGPLSQITLKSSVGGPRWQAWAPSDTRKG